MTAFLISIGVVALAEIGDKTQLLALALAAKYRKPWPIIFGILFATLANHFLAGAVGTWLTRTIGPEVMRWALGLSFIAMALWMLVPDKLDDECRKGVALRCVRYDTDRVLPCRNGRQDADRDHRARGAL